VSEEVELSPSVTTSMANLSQTVTLLERSVESTSDAAIAKDPWEKVSENGEEKLRDLIPEDAISGNGIFATGEGTPGGRFSLRGRGRSHSGRGFVIFVPLHEPLLSARWLWREAGRLCDPDSGDVVRRLTDSCHMRRISREVGRDSEGLL
jgi:hypothetical protein